MEVIIRPNQDAVDEVGTRLIVNLMRAKPGAVLGLATGSTPVGLYRKLIQMHRERGLDFSRITTFNLDEYLGLPPDHPASYHRFMHENFIDHVNIDPRRVHIPDGLAKDIPAFCREYEAAIIEAGGIDLQLLGIGRDGHIGFNEPSSSLGSRTRIKTLAPSTIAANRRFFSSDNEVPRHVITMGIGTIMESRSCVLLAIGDNKADAVSAMVEGPVSATCPASVLQLHPHVMLVIDESAARLLKRADYYRYVYANKPSFQNPDLMTWPDQCRIQ